jgi:hypothetical protein
MSYLRGPMTRDQIASVMSGTAAARPTTTADGPEPASTAPADDLAGDETTVMPDVASGVTVRWIDVASPWLRDAGGDPNGTRLDAAVVARVRLRYDETKADLVHDEEYECVLAPLGESVDVSRALAVDYDDRDLRPDPQSADVYRIGTAPLSSKTYFSSIERDLRDHLTRSLTMELPANPDLKLYARPGETVEAFATRCAAAARERADADTAALRDKYETRVTKLRDSIDAAEDRVDVLEAEADGKRNSELLSTAGSILGGLLGGRSRSGMLGKLGTAAGRRGSSNASRRRVDAAEGKVGRLREDLLELESELAADVAEIDAKWSALAGNVTTLPITLERTDVTVTSLVLAWMPVA